MKPTPKAIIILITVGVALFVSGLVRAQQDTATGSGALANDNNINQYNTADGYFALNASRASVNNTAVGASALQLNTANNNTAIGYDALVNNTTGNINTAVGCIALNFNSTGSNNIAVGYSAGRALTTGSNNIEIGAIGVAAEANTIRIGTQGTQTTTVVAGIWNSTTAAGLPVYINSNGQLGTLPSSARFKQNILSMGKVSDELLALRPVTFEYKPEIDPTGTPQFGLVAEEVAKVDPELVVHDSDHHIQGVRYEAVNALMLSELQKQHETIVEQQKALADQQKLLQSLAARLSQIEQSKEEPK